MLRFLGRKACRASLSKFDKLVRKAPAAVRGAARNKGVHFRLELLEDRTLLAALQFSAGLGEQSTLDSVAQTANYLSVVNDPDSQQFTHNDGTAVSNVTLKSAASDTGNPGVNLDILSQGSVAKNGIANVSVNAGLSNASGSIGTTVSVPITIVATDPSEKAGDPITVQFSFAFNVKTFASNNATASLSYAASYTYNGTTTPLASSDDELGGEGITQIGAGPVDDETGTLHAHIGDSFTVSLSENLAGQTIAPFLGAGINNVGWLVDSNLDVSLIGKTAIVPTSVVWDYSPSAGVDFDYQVTGPASTDPTPVAFYWASGTDYTTDVLGQLAYRFTVPAGTKAQTQPYGPIRVAGSNLIGAPEGTKYLLVVTDPDDTLGTFDPQANVIALQILQPVQPVYQNLGYWAVSPGYLLGHSTGQTIAGSGCALTDLVMALQFAGVQTDPVLLNNLLSVSQNGYAGKDSLNWGPATAIGAGAANDFTVHWNPVVTSDPQALRDLLTSTSAPVVVRVQNVHADGTVSEHFVLVTGIDGDTFWINDPGYTSRTTLDEYNGFTTLGYVSDPTNDLSALYVASSSAGTGLNLAVGDAQGLVTGIPSGGVQPLNQIPNAVYFVEGPVEDLTNQDPGTSTAQFVYISQPGNTTYGIQGSGTTGQSELEFAGIATDGTVQSQQSVTVQSPSGSPLQYPVYIDPTYNVAASTAQQPTSLSAVSAIGTRAVTATLSATLTSDGLPLVGQTVGFTLNESGTVTPVGTATTDVSGVATLTDLSLAGFNAGIFADVVGASFAGDSNDAGSSASGTLNVTPPAVGQVALGSSANPSLPGELITFGVMVIALSDGPTPTGTIQFEIDGSSFGAPVPLAGGAAASDLVTSLAVGSHMITAIYSGDTTYHGTTATLTQTVESPLTVKGHVYTVTSLGDTGAGSGISGDLRYAITQANANPGSVIDFSVMGTIQLTQALPDVMADMTIDGPGPSLLTLKGGGASSNFRIFIVDSGLTAVISGVTMTGGNITGPGGAIADSGALTLSDSILSGNTATTQGGAVMVYGGTNPSLTVTDCTVTGNSSDGTNPNFSSGGGIADLSGALTLTDSIISGNTATVGGGIQGGSPLTMAYCSVIENYAGQGGGINSDGNMASLKSCNISGNTTKTAGGGIYGNVWGGGGLSLTDCTLSGNKATLGDGGAIWTYTQSGKTTLTNCVLSNNSAYSGGAIYNRGVGGALTITGCALTSNSASYGGALSSKSQNATLTNSTISGNTAHDGGGIFSPVGDVLTFNDCTISANSATALVGGINNGFGGGIFNNGEVTLTDSTISGNSAVTGGGIADMSQFHSNTAPPYPAISNLSGCTVSGNSATSYGGGIENEGTLTLTDSTISGNSAAKGGGIASPIRSQTHLYAEGVAAYPIADSQATITGSSIAANTVTKYGGGIMNEGALTLTNSTLSGNTATQDGGGIANLSLTLFYPQGGAASNAPAVATLADCTLYANTSLSGGAIGNEEANLTLTNDTLTANRTNATGPNAAALETISSVGDILLNNTLVAGNLQGVSPSTTPGDVGGTVDATSADNLIGDGDLLIGISNGVQGNQIGSASGGTLLNANLGPMANNGGPTETVALLAGSTAIDKGSNALAVDTAAKLPLTWDGRGPGFARTVNNVVDIGAFEYGAFLVTPTKLAATPAPPASVTVGASFSLTVTAEDDAGDAALAFDAPVTVAIASGPVGAVLGGTLTESPDMGVATFTGLTLTELGPYTLIVSGGGLTGKIEPYQVTPGAPVQLVFTTEPPAQVFTGESFQVIVDAEDSQGFVNPSYSGNATVALISNPGGAPLGGVRTVPVDDGVATFSGLTLNAADDGYLLQVTSGTLVPATTGDIDVTTEPVNQLVIATQPPASVVAGAGFGLIVDADSSGAVDANFNGKVTVGLLDEPGVTLGGTLSATAIKGVATFAGLTLGPAGNGYTLELSSNGYASTTTSGVNVTAPVVPGVPAAPVLAAQSDTGVSSNDGLTRDNGSAAAPLTFTVAGISPANSFVQLYNNNNPGKLVLLGSPVQATGGNATITLSGTPLPDGIYEIVVAATYGGIQSTPSGNTPVTIESSLTITTTNPASGAFVTDLPNGQVSVSFSHALAGLTDGEPALSASDPNALTLTPSTGPALALTTIYHVYANGTSSILLTPISPPVDSVLSLQVNLSAFTDLAGNSVSDPGGGHVTFTVTGPNATVTINPIPSQMVAPGGVLRVQLTAANPNLDQALVWSLAGGAPAGASIDPRTGVFTWAPSLGQAGLSYSITVTTALQGIPGVTDAKLLTITVLSPPQIMSVNTTQLHKRRVNKGTIAINISFNEQMAPSAGNSNFYSVVTPTKVHTRKGTKIKLVPVRFTSRSSGTNRVTLTLSKPSKLHLTLIVRSGASAMNGLSLGRDITFPVQ